MRKNDSIFRTGLTYRMWNSFKKIETEENLKSHADYYRALSQWVTKHERLIGHEALHWTRLDVLLGLNPDKYVTANCGISLEMEGERMFGRKKPKHLESLAQSIGSTLWCMATVHSGKDCPDCIYDGGLLYVIVSSDRIHNELAFMCDYCERILSLTGQDISESSLTIVPANREDIPNANIDVVR